MRKNSTKSAFTLIEMAVVLFIISLLLLIVIPNVSNQKKHAGNISDEALKTELTTQRQLYLSDNPEATSVSLEELQAANYLTANQVKQIREHKLDEG